MGKTRGPNAKESDLPYLKKGAPLNRERRGITNGQQQQDTIDILKQRGDPMRREHGLGEARKISSVERLRSPGAHA